MEIELGVELDKRGPSDKSESEVPTSLKPEVLSLKCKSKVPNLTFWTEAVTKIT